MFNSPRRTLCFLSAALLIGLFSGGLTLAKKGGGKPGSDLPAPDPSSGVIYFWDQGDPYGDLGLVVKMNWDGTGIMRLVNCGVNNASLVMGWDASHGNSTRFFVYGIFETNDPPDGAGLFVATEAGDPQQRILAYGSKPALSPDDSRVAFVAPRISEPGYAIYVGSLDYDEASEVPTGVDSVVSVADIEGYARLSELFTWAPDGSRIAFCQSGNGSLRKNDVFVVSLDASAGYPTTNVTNSPEVFEVEPAWSPNGGRIAFRVPGRRSDDIYTVFSDGTGLALAISKDNSGVKDNYLPTWSLDGQQLAFRAIRRTGEAIMRSEADGTTSAADLTGFSSGRRVRRICWRQ